VLINIESGAFVGPGHWLLRRNRVGILGVAHVVIYGVKVRV
jgi:hypothetical protein